MKIRTFLRILPILVATLSLVAFDGRNDEPEFYMATDRIYLPGASDVSVTFSGRLPRRTSVEMTLYRIKDPIAFFAKLQDPHRPGFGAEDKSRVYDVGDARLFSKVKEWKANVTPRNRYWSYERIDVPVSERGTWLVTAKAAGRTAATVVLLSEYGIVTKQSPSEVLAWVVDRRTGEHVAGMPLLFKVPGGGSAKGTTDARGIARVDLDPLRKGVGENDEWRWGSSLVVMGERQGGLAIADAWFYRTYGTGEELQTWMQTDRPVYRPSQKVYYRGIVRRATTDGTWSNVTDSLVRVTINDPRGNVVARDTLPLSDLGTFDDSLTLGEEPPLGHYSIMTQVGGATSGHSFEVLEYRKPEYEVNVRTDREHYTKGDRITATVDARYYFGSPVSDGTVEYSVFRSPYWRPWWRGTRWAYLYELRPIMPYREQMEMIHNGSGKLNADGTFTFSYQTDAKLDGDYTYTVQAKVVDPSRRTITGSSQVMVTRGEFTVNVRTGAYVYRPGEEATAIVTVAPFVGDAKIAAPFDVKVTRTWWESNGRRRDGSKSETIYTGSGTTGSDGTGSVRFTVAGSGYYTVEATARDSRGTAISASTSLYVTDGSYASWGSVDGELRVIADRDLYHPGETMTALVIAPELKGDLLMTAEGATIYASDVISLGSGSAVVRLPITDAMAPNFFLSLSTIQGERLVATEERISVAPDGKLLTVTIETDRTTYRPGDRGTVTLRVTDDKGRAVPNVELAMSMVDEALYAIRPDQTTAIERFFYGERWNRVSTSSSLTFRFYDQSREMAATEVAMQDASGAAAPPSAPLMRAARNKFEERQDAAPLVQPQLRSDFRDLMKWMPAIRTGSDGLARVEVTFPDNLTEWRITARGVTRQTQVGQASASVVARKELLVRMETPRFITQGDELVIATTVHNYLKGAKRVRLEFAAEGVESAERERTIMVAAEGEERVDWRVKAPTIGEARFTIKALTDEESDAMELRIPVLPEGVRTSRSAMADIAELRGTRSVSMQLPARSLNAAAGLTISLSPSAASAILGSLDQLIGYPYGCVEQTMSRFLPTVMVADVLRSIDIPFDSTLRLEIPKMAAKGLERLYQLQHDDGGWGWWEHDATNPFMTAYVLYGMSVASGNGYPVDQERFERGHEALRRLIESALKARGKERDLTTIAYMLYVATKTEGVGAAGRRRQVEALADEDEINNYALALLTMAASHLGEGKLAARFADRLAYQAKQNELGTYWPGRTWHYNWQDDEVETSANAVKALLMVPGHGEMVDRGVRWLLAQRRGDAWHNTRQTAMVVYALVDYLKGTKELRPDYRLTVKVNGTTVAERRMTAADVYAPATTITVDPKLLRAGGNEIVVEKEGEGKLYASARLDYYATGDDIRSASGGFTVKRTYYELQRVLRDGRFVYEKHPFDGGLESGRELLVKVSVTPASSYDYVMIEDPLPAGCEVVEETSGYTIVGESGYGGGDGGYGYEDYMPRWGWWYADRSVRDEKVAFFATQMPASPHEFSYILRAQIPGSYRAMPTVAALMYYPEVRGNAEMTPISIGD